jgi:hypothetical protein
MSARCMCSSALALYTHVQQAIDSLGDDECAMHVNAAVQVQQEEYNACAAVRWPCTLTSSRLRSKRRATLSCGLLGMTKP